MKELSFLIFGFIIGLLIWPVKFKLGYYYGLGVGYIEGFMRARKIKGGK